MFQNTFGFLHARFQTGSARTQHKKQHFNNISVICISIIRKIAMMNSIQKGRIYVANSYEYKVRIGTDYLLSSNFESKTILILIYQCVREHINLLAFYINTFLSLYYFRYPDFWSSSMFWYVKSNQNEELYKKTWPRFSKNLFSGVFSGGTPWFTPFRRFNCN